MIQRILPPAVAVAEVFGDHPDAALYPEEQEVVAYARESRGAGIRHRAGVRTGGAGPARAARGSPAARTGRRSALGRGSYRQHHPLCRLPGGRGRLNRAGRVAGERARLRDLATRAPGTAGTARCSAPRSPSQGVVPADRALAGIRVGRHPHRLVRRHVHRAPVRPGPVVAAVPRRPS